ncbi:MAG: conjugal transfer protein TraX, partial [Pseudobutyrivibrio sp.]|nr:conjugal transfer protein TraX [Pseudobutyrivibrio sp.]
MSDVIVTQEIESGGKGGITGSTLKIIAIIAMFIDHFAAILLNGYINTMLPADFYSWSVGDMSAWYVSHPEFARVYIIYIVFRCIGRLGFPIFAFLLVEGFGHTRNVKKYARNLIIFALVSELPFNLGFNSTLLCPRYQNVFFTLFIALLVLCGIKYLPEKLKLNENMSWVVYAGGFLTGIIVTGAAKSSSFGTFMPYG